jgi:hypothetical protein
MTGMATFTDLRAYKSGSVEQYPRLGKKDNGSQQVQA